MKDEFVKTPADKRSMNIRSLLYGVGINDAWYNVSYVEDGKRVRCPAYKRWDSMLQRCYSKRKHKKCPTYEGCTVSVKWLTFSNFAKWYDDHDQNKIKDLELDKDIKFPGNKIYAEYSCLFVPRAINNLFKGRIKTEGELPIGVTYSKQMEKLKSTISIDGKHTHLGYFNKICDANIAYTEARNAEILSKSKQYPEYSKYLIQHIQGCNDED